jgi:hypothetical protein
VKGPFLHAAGAGARNLALERRQQLAEQGVPTRQPLAGSARHEQRVLGFQANEALEDIGFIRHGIYSPPWGTTVSRR